MRVGLEKLDADGLALDLPMGVPPTEQRVATVRKATGLRGRLESGADRLVISGLAVAALDLDTLHLDFGAVVVDAAASEDAGGAPNELRRVQGRLEQRKGELGFDLRAAHVHIPRLVVDVVSQGIQVSGDVHITEARLVVEGSTGRIEGKAVEVASFRVRFGEIELTVPTLHAKAMTIGWGEHFRLEAESIEAPELTFTLGAAGANFAATGAALRDLRVHAADVDLGTATFESMRADLSFSPEPSSEEPAPAEPSERAPLFDLRHLDGLSGELNVDLVVDISVPVIGSRRATHRFRIPIDAGSLDYIGLEGDLSALESALLDFAVRDDGTFVLELGIPLLPTRGRGKPILVWDLTPEDRALANRQRVRVALLPKARFASEATESAKKKDESAFALRQIGMRSVDADLSLSPVSGEVEGAVEALSVQKITLKGNIHHEPKDPTRAGELRGEVKGLALALRPLALGGQRLAVARVGIDRATELRVRFVDVRPTSVHGVLEKLALDRLSLRAT
jgi:hypothetical protein